MASDIRPPTDKKTGKARSKVALRPGFHLMDWMRLPLSPQRPRPVTSAELAEHKTKYDCWTALNGKVYNITQYLDYHPGGSSILMKGAGKDCTALFNKYHAWVNIDGLLTKCLVGILVDESTTSIEEGEEEEELEQAAGRDDALRLLQEEGDEHQDQHRDQAAPFNTMPPPRSTVFRVNPGLQNLAAGGTVHDAAATGGGASTTSDI